MLRHTLIGLILGTSLSFGGLFIDSASAQNASDNTGGNVSDITGGNLSDNTGGNVSDITGANSSTFTEIGTLNPQIVNEAQQIAADLTEANNNGSSSDTRTAPNNQTTVAKKAEKFLENITKKVERANSKISGNRLW